MSLPDAGLAAPLDQGGLEDAGSPDAGQQSGADIGGMDLGPAPEACEGKEADFEALLSSFERRLAQSGIPGGALAVLCEGERIFAGGVGVTDLRSGAAVDGHTRFQIASITKTLTGALALRMSAQNRVDLNAPASEHLPFVNTSAPYVEAFTLDQLLSHTAGYPTYYPGGGDGSDLSLEGYFTNNRQAQLWAPPGAVFNYSNIGMSLAGLALQRATGTMFGPLMEAEVFGPLGLVDSSMNAADVEAQGRFAFGHTNSVTNLVRPTDSYLPTGYYGPMGGAWMSATDLAAFGRALIRPQPGFLERASTDNMASPRMATGEASSYGLGLFVDDLYSDTHLSHGGSVGGYLAGLDLFVESGFGMALLINGDWDYPWDFLDEALQRFTNIRFEDFTHHLPSSADWQDFVGTYEDPIMLGTVQITVEGGRLTVSIPDQGISAPLEGYTKHAYGFFYPPWNSDLALVFYREGETGPAKYLVSLEGIATRAN